MPEMQIQGKVNDKENKIIDCGVNINTVLSTILIYSPSFNKITLFSLFRHTRLRCENLDLLIIAP